MNMQKTNSAAMLCLSSNVCICEEGRSSSQHKKVSSALNMYKTESVAKLDEVSWLNSV